MLSPLLEEELMGGLWLENHNKRVLSLTGVKGGVGSCGGWRWLVVAGGGWHYLVAAARRLPTVVEAIDSRLAIRVEIESW